MKKIGLLLALVTISIFASHAQSEPLAKYRIVDAYEDAKFGLDPNGQRPNSVSAYATDNEVHCYNFATETCNVVHFGDLIHVLPSGNVVVQGSGFAQDQNGHELPGRGLFDYVVSPTGKVLWKSSIYGQ